MHIRIILFCKYKRTKDIAEVVELLLEHEVDNM
jgi:hypothetical protein